MVFAGQAYESITVSLHEFRRLHLAVQGWPQDGQET